ncbi:stabilizer of axonemal microtubules 1 [Orussus abietinus]|uniref:stabilizer of axonemal microtubules 1 n=1 Tax=Orussus abietinus TaxID=222816 RepID=UPI000C716072|nr:stabilizer of axonemal microtubules 1 [Orussus abietinus]
MLPLYHPPVLLQKYVQPPVAKSYAPIRYYHKTDVPMEGNTTYRLSFWEGPGGTREAIRPENCLAVGDGFMSDDTTHKLSYLGNWCVKPEDPITPCDRQWLGRGPMQDVTTQKHDYTWKIAPKEEPYSLRPNLYFPCASMSDDTTYRLSYFQSACRIPEKPFKPIRRYERSDVPMDGCTTYRLSYWPSELPGKEPQPWNSKVEYHPPVVPLEGCTTYKLSYWPNREEPRKPFILKDTENILNAKCCFDDNTTYGLSYFGCGGDKREPIRQSQNILLSPCPLSHDTTHRMSYLGNWCAKPERSIIPCTRDLLGRGPMQDLTTQKHDFVWKCGTPDSEIRPEDNLSCSPMPLECCTTHRLSFLPNDPSSLIRNKPYAPIRRYESSDVPMEKETTMRLSYQPVEPADQVEKHWGNHSQYIPRVTPMEDDTTYNLSYILPGTLEPLPPCCPPCPPANPCIPCASG